MKKYEDLNDNEKKLYEAEISKSLKPFEDRGIIQKSEHDFWKNRPLWKSFSWINKLIDTVDLAIKEKWWSPKYIMINWSQVMLSFLPFIMVLKSYDEEPRIKLDEYRKELLKNSTSSYQP